MHALEDTFQNLKDISIQGISTKRMEVLGELERLKIDIAALTETKRKGQGMEEGKNYIQIYSGVNKDQRAKCGVSLLIKKKYKKCIKEWQYINERIVQVQIRLNGHDVNIVGVYAPNDDADDKQKENFYNTLGCMMDKNSSRKEIIILGDLNARTGSKRNDAVVGPHGELMINDSGSRLIEYCGQYGFKIMNGFYQHRDIHRYTWTQTSRKLKSIIDYIIIKQNTQCKPQDVRVYRGAECGSDHYLIIAKIYLPYRKRRNEGEVDKEEEIKLEEPRYKTTSLQQDSIRFLYVMRVAKRVPTIEEGNPEQMYEKLKVALQGAAYEALGQEEVLPRKTTPE